MNQEQWIKKQEKRDIEAKEFIERFAIPYDGAESRGNKEYPYINYLDFYFCFINPDCLHNNDVLLDFYIKYLADILVMFIYKSVESQCGVFTIGGSNLLQRFLGLINIRDSKLK